MHFYFWNHHNWNPYHHSLNFLISFVKRNKSPRWSVESWIEDFKAKLNSSKVYFIPRFGFWYANTATSHRERLVPLLPTLLLFRFISSDRSVLHENFTHLTPQGLTLYILTLLKYRTYQRAASISYELCISSLFLPQQNQLSGAEKEKKV